MTQTIIDGQRLLVAVSAVGRGFALILAVEGEVAARELREVSPVPDDHQGLDELPDAPGIYVWEGEVDTERSATPRWRGEWARATVADLLTFRFHVRTVCQRHGVVREIDADDKMFCRACKAAAGEASGIAKRAARSHALNCAMRTREQTPDGWKQGECDCHLSATRAYLAAEMIERLRRDGIHAPDCASRGFIRASSCVKAAECDCHLATHGGAECTICRGFEHHFVVVAGGTYSCIHCPQRASMMRFVGANLERMEWEPLDDEPVAGSSVVVGD